MPPLLLALAAGAAGLVLGFRRGAARASARTLDEEAQRYLAAIVESSDDAIIGKTMDGIVTSWNRGAERMYGYTAEEMVGRPVSILVPPDMENDIPEIMDRLRQGERVENQLSRRQRKDGVVLDVALTISPVRDERGRVIGASTIARDVTEQVRAEAALRAAKREAEAANQAKSDFLAIMSHELRTPLNVVIGYSDLLKEGGAGALDERQTEYLDRIRGSAYHLLTIIEQILGLSRIETGREKVRIEQVEITGHTRETAGMIEPLAARKPIRFHVVIPDRPIRLATDPGKVRQILLNLLSNAVKFTDRGSITIEARHITPTAPPSFPVHPCCAPGEEGWLALAVSDTGIGIPEEQVEHIFSEFVQLPIAMHRQRGTGLGLAISSRLARLLGGEIAVRSEVGVSSTFVLFLPCPAPVLEAETVGA